MERERNTSCQRRCYNYMMSHEAAVPPEDCSGLIEITPVVAEGSEGQGSYRFQICPRLTYQDRHAVHIFHHGKPASEMVGHTVVLHRQAAPPAEELQQIIHTLEENPRANVDIY